jgi:hypothetical protein
MNKMIQMHYKKYIYKGFILFSGMMVMFLFSCCNNEIVEPDVVEPATIELHFGYSIQLVASSKNVEWVSDNPSVATVSPTGLVTAISKGTATIYTYSPGGKQDVICYLEIYPKRNILFYVAADEKLTNNDAPEKIRQICAGWGPYKGEMIIYIDRQNTGAYLLRVNETKNDSGRYGLDTLENYGPENSADPEVLKRVINKTVQDYPADSYGMIFFSHASGWLPEGTLTHPRSLVIDGSAGQKREMEYYEFASAITDQQFDFIIFEACLMADVMSMYELRNKAEYVLASSAEIVSPGFSSNGVYKDEVMRLYDTKNDIKSVVSGFAQSYYNYIATIPENSAYCSATLSLIKMDEMEALTSATKTILNGTEIDEKNLTLSDVQRFDRPRELGGGSYSRYFDFAHTVEQLAPESDYMAFNKQLDKTVVWKVATKRFLLNGYDDSPNLGEYNGFFIERHSGLTTYISQDVYPFLKSQFMNSSWYKAIY